MDLTTCVLGIELGSTRIKAVLADEKNRPVAYGSFEWENEYTGGVWTYSMENIQKGIRECYADLKQNVRKLTGETLTEMGAVGVSGMMHGLMAFDSEWELLVPFRTWRNTMTGEAAEELTRLFGFNIPQRWSIAHLYQAMLNRESCADALVHLTTLAGYIHHLLTGENVIGIGEASGVFPVDSAALDYDGHMLDAFEKRKKEMGYSWSVKEVLPKVLVAGVPAGRLTREGAAFLDPEGDLKPGILFCPPEGDAGTGMTATNSVRPGTGNVSAGTSDFAMVVVDKLPGVHREIDMVTTPAGAPVAMVHCNNCTSDINAWVRLLCEFGSLMGAKIDTGEAFTKLFQLAETGKKDGGGLLSYNYLSGEGVTDLNEGRPLFLRMPDSGLDLADFMRTHLMSALATLKIGLDILTKEENIKISRICGHGGYFKTPGVGQKLLSAAIEAPVSVMETAGEGGPYGMALLAGFLLKKEDGESLSDYLDHKVFQEAVSTTLMAGEEDIEGFRTFTERYKKALCLEKRAVEVCRKD